MILQNLILVYTVFLAVPALLLAAYVLFGPRKLYKRWREALNRRRR